MVVEFNPQSLKTALRRRLYQMTQGTSCPLQKEAGFIRRMM
jgi:hypothetical protein